MVAILQKYRIALIILAALILMTVIWIFIFKQSNNKIPMRGVFVMQNPYSVELRCF